MTTTGPIVTMADGVPGFEQCRRFIIVTSQVLEPFTCLQSLDEPKPSFLTLDPHRLVDDFAMPLTEGDRTRLDARDADTLLWLTIVRIEDESASANLRAPIVINPRTMLGIQVIPGESSMRYSIAHPLPVD